MCPPKWKQHDFDEGNQRRHCTLKRFRRQHKQQARLQIHWLSLPAFPSAEVYNKGNACKHVRICSWRRGKREIYHLTFATSPECSLCEQNSMKTWQTDGERNTNSAGDCIQGKPAPMFLEMRTFSWKLVLFLMLCYSVLSTFTLVGLIWYTFTIFLQHYIPQNCCLCL